jgi:hypothetical protein
MTGAPGGALGTSPGFAPSPPASAASTGSADIARSSKVDMRIGASDVLARAHNPLVDDVEAQHAEELELPVLALVVFVHLALHVVHERCIAVAVVRPLFAYSLDGIVAEDLDGI